MLSLALACGLAVAIFLCTALVSGLRCPLAAIPGPWYSRFTHLVLKYEVIRGRRVFYVHHLHQKYGPLVRIAPQEVAVADVAAFSQIHKIGAGFCKSSWYDTITPNRSPGIFVMRDPHRHAARRRLFAQPFSNSALQKNWAVEIRSRVEIAVSRIREEASRGDADVLRWWTLMATDLITHLCFGESFRMLEQGKVSILTKGPTGADSASKHRTSTRSSRRCFCPFCAPRPSLSMHWRGCCPSKKCRTSFEPMK